MEILLVVAAIAMLSSVTIVHLNPGKKLGDTRDSKRWLDVSAILNASYNYTIENNGALPGAIPSTPTEICRTGANCQGLADLSALTDNEQYLVAIPLDPTGSSENGTGYTISARSNGRMTVAAPHAEGETPIILTQ